MIDIRYICDTWSYSKTDKLIISCDCLIIVLEIEIASLNFLRKTENAYSYVHMMQRS